MDERRGLSRPHLRTQPPPAVPTRTPEDTNRRPRCPRWPKPSRRQAGAIRARSLPPKSPMGCVKVYNLCNEIEKSINPNHRPT